MNGLCKNENEKAYYNSVFVDIGYLFLWLHDKRGTKYILYQVLRYRDINLVRNGILYGTSRHIAE